MSYAQSSFKEDRDREALKEENQQKTKHKQAKFTRLEKDFERCPRKDGERQSRGRLRVEARLQKDV